MSTTEQRLISYVERTLDNLDDYLDEDPCPVALDAQRKLREFYMVLWGKTRAPRRPLPDNVLWQI